MTFIASSTGFYAYGQTYVDTDDTFNVAAGDLIVAYCVNGYGAANLTWLGEDDGTSNELTPWAATGGNQLEGGYLLSASANAAATFRATWDDNSNGFMAIIVMQFRPASGETVGYAAGPASANDPYGSNPTSAQVSSGQANSIYVGASISDRDDQSSFTLCGGAADGSDGLNNADTGSWYVDAAYRILSSQQTNQTYSCTATDTVWSAQCNVFDVTVSGGGISIPVVMHHYAMLRN